MQTVKIHYSKIFRMLSKSLGNVQIKINPEIYMQLLFLSKWVKMCGSSVMATESYIEKKS